MQEIERKKIEKIKTETNEAQKNNTYNKGKKIRYLKEKKKRLAIPYPV